MAYKPYNPYSSQRERSIFRFLPFFLAFLMLALMGWAGYRGYKSADPKPKPVVSAPRVISPTYELTCSGNGGAPSDEGCIAYRPQASTTVWLRCNAGMEVTDLRMCPEFKQRESTVGIDLAYAWSQRPRKHKRKTEPGHLWLAMAGQSPSTIEDYNPHGHITLERMKNLLALGQDCILMINGECWITLDPDPAHKYGEFTAVPTPYDYEWTFVNTLPTMIHCSKLTGIMHGECESHPLTPEEIDRYKPIAEKPHPSDEGIWYAHPTTPADITNLMEQIAPTKPKSEIITQSYDGCNTTTYANGVATSTTLAYCPPNSFLLVPKPAPDCKMPADVDVCPTPALEPKARHD